MSLKSWQLPAFKSAMRQRFQSVNKRVEPYPLIQYKTRKHLGEQQAMLLVLGDKIVELKSDLTHETPWIQMNGQKRQLQVAGLKLLPFPLRISDRLHTYNLFNYQPFNQDNYAHFLKLEKGEAQLDFIQNLLVRHLHAFARGVGWTPSAPIRAERAQVIRPKTIPYQNFKAQCFDLSFRTNLWIPEHIGLGKGVSLGFGVLRLPGRTDRSER